MAPVLLVWTGGEVQGGFLGWPVSDLAQSGLVTPFRGRSRSLPSVISPDGCPALVTIVSPPHRQDFLPADIQTQFASRELIPETSTTAFAALP